MAKILTVAVTYWQPVTEVYTIKVADEYDLEIEQAKAELAGKPDSIYETLTVEGVQVITPENGPKEDFEYEQRQEQYISSAVGAVQPS